MTPEQIKHIRADFPILQEKVYNRPLIYFDNGATTQKPRQVLDKLMYGYTHLNGNIHRGVHYLSQQATEAHEAARKTVAEFLNAASANEIVFVRNTTEAVNLVAYSYGEAFCSEGDEIIVSAMEHHSNIVPWQVLCERKKMKLRVIPVSKKGELRLDVYETLLNPQTKLVSVAHVSNVLGTINPLEEIIGLAHANNTPVMIDGAQGAAHARVDVQALDVDFYAFSGHKIYAPTGISALYGKREWLEKIPPYQGGGEMIQNVTFGKTIYNELPFKFEAGTPDYIGSTALAEAIRYVQNIGLDVIAEHETELVNYATERMMEIDQMRIIGTSEHKSSVISFLVGNLHPYDIGMLLDKLGIAIRTGHHCAQPLMEEMGILATARASFALYNTKEEIDVFVDALKRVVGMLG